MGARQSKRSVDITTTPKKEGLPAEGSVGDAAAPGDGKLERIEEADTKPTTNGIGPHTETVEEKNQDEATEKDKEEVKVEETKAEATADAPVETAEVTTPTEATPASQTTATSPESKETKKKEKSKKYKFSFRTLSFGKKDKTKPAREDTPKNGDVAKEEPLVEGGEEAENATATASSPTDKSEVSSPVESEAAPATEAKEVEKPADEKKEEAAPAEKEKPAEKVEAAVAEKVEVSGGARPTTGQQFVQVIGTHTEPIATPSIIERKTSEDLPSQFPSSPPPTPIDPSPLQQAQQAAASAKALAEALKLPAEAASNKTSISFESSLSFDEHTPTPKESAVAQLATQSETNSHHENKQNPESETVQTLPTQVQEIVKQVQDIVQESVNQVLESISNVEEIVQECVSVQQNVSVLENVQSVQDSVQKIKQITDDVEKTDEFLNDQNKPNVDLVIQTEEGPIPICGDVVIEAKPAVIVPEENETKVEVLLEAGESGLKDSSTTVSEQMFAAGESVKISAVDLRSEPIASLSEPTISSPSPEESDVPPPLPDSPAPLAQETPKLLSFVNAQVPPFVQPLESESTKIDDMLENSQLPEAPACDDLSDSLDDLPPVPQELVTCEEDSFTYPLPPDDLSLHSLPADSQESRIPTESILTPPQSPVSASVTSCTMTARKCSETQVSDDQSNRDFKVESVSESLNSYNESEERLAQSESVVSQLTNGHIENHQSIPEPEAPVENNVSGNEISTTESVDEAPKSPPPAVPVEVSVSPAPAPVITEDVASVTKAIEEIDINDKAVAAAVNEAIEKSNANEIVVDSNHQSHLNE